MRSWVGLHEELGGPALTVSTGVRKGYIHGLNMDCLGCDVFVIAARTPI